MVRHINIKSMVFCYTSTFLCFNNVQFNAKRITFIFKFQTMRKISLITEDYFYLIVNLLTEVMNLALARVYFDARGPSRCSNGQRLLGIVLSRTWNSTGWNDTIRQSIRNKRLFQYFFQRNQFWQNGTACCDGRPRAHSRWLV